MCCTLDLGWAGVRYSGGNHPQGARGMKCGSRQTLRLALGLSFAGSAVSMAATPCPPPTVSVQGGSSGATTCPQNTGGGSGGTGTTYTTNFPNNENPISEGGKWTHVGQDWTLVQTQG